MDADTGDFGEEPIDRFSECVDNVARPTRTDLLTAGRPALELAQLELSGQPNLGSRLQSLTL